jgi:SAM-dependent methyltransferase
MDISKIEQQREHFNSISEKYFRERQTKNHLFYKNLMWNMVFTPLEISNKNVLKVLEPMCGYSEGLKIIKQHIGTNIDYQGFDYSEEILKKANDLNPGINIFKQDITTFESNTEFDLIILIGGLHHVPQYLDTSLVKLHQSLTPTGIFINFEPTHNSWINQKIREKIYKKNEIFDEATEEGFVFTALNSSYQNAGFKIKKQYYCGLLAYIFYYNPDAFPFFNKGNTTLVKLFFTIDKLLMETPLAKYFSFATISVLEKRKFTCE